MRLDPARIIDGLLTERDQARAECERLKACYATSTTAEAKLQAQLAEARNQSEKDRAELATCDDQRLSWRQQALLALEESYVIPRLRAALAKFADRENWIAYEGDIVTWRGDSEQPWAIAQEALSLPEPAEVT